MIQISHKQALRFIQRHLDHLPMTPEQWAALQAHLEGCADCRAAQDRLLSTERGLRRALPHGWMAVPGPFGDPTDDIRLALTSRKKIRSIQRYALAVLVFLGLAALGITRLPETFGETQQGSAGRGRDLSLTQAALTPTARTYLDPRANFSVGLVYIRPLAFGPDGSPTRSDLFLLNAGQGRAEETNLTQDIALDSDPLWSPDGEWIAFLSNAGAIEDQKAEEARGSSLPANLAQRRDIYVISIAGTHRTRLTADLTMNWRGPLTWSADGRYIAASGEYVGPGKPSSWIYLVPLDGSPPIRLSDTWAGLDPTFAPRGTLLAFRRGATFNGERPIMVEDIATGRSFTFPVANGCGNDAKYASPASSSLKPLEGGFAWSLSASRQETRLAYWTSFILPDGKPFPELCVSQPIEGVDWQSALEMSSQGNEYSQAIAQGNFDSSVPPVWTTMGDQLVVQEDDQLPDPLHCRRFSLGLFASNPYDKKNNIPPPFCVTGQISEGGWRLPMPTDRQPEAWFLAVGSWRGQNAPWALTSAAPLEFGQQADSAQRLGIFAFNESAFNAPFLADIPPVALISVPSDQAETIAASLRVRPGGNRLGIQPQVGKVYEPGTVTSGVLRIDRFRQETQWTGDLPGRVLAVRWVADTTGPRREIVELSVPGNYNYTGAPPLVTYSLVTGRDAHCPRLAPDGKHLAYIAETGLGTTELFVAELPKWAGESGLQNVAQVSVARARPNPADPHWFAGCPVWSNDGDRLAVLAEQQGQAYLAYYRLGIKPVALHENGASSTATSTVTPTAQAFNSLVKTESGWIKLSSYTPMTDPIWYKSNDIVFIGVRSGLISVSLSSLAVEHSYSWTFGTNGVSTFTDLPKYGKLGAITLPDPLPELRVFGWYSQIWKKMSLPEYDPIVPDTGYGWMADGPGMEIRLIQRKGPVAREKSLVQSIDLTQSLPKGENPKLNTLAALPYLILKAAWSPDRSWLIYSSDVGTGLLYLNPSPNAVNRPVWLSDEGFEDLEW